MPWDVSFNPSAWPSLLAAVFFAALGATLWRRRSVPGAPQLTAMLLLSSIWGAGTALAAASTTAGSGVFWIGFSYIWLMPIAAARLAFVLEYTDPGRWLTRSVSALLAFTSFLPAAVVFTNEWHHLISFYRSANGQFNASTGLMGWGFTSWAYLLALLGLVQLARLYVRSPRYRYPVAVVMLAQVTVHAAFALDNFSASLPLSFNLTAAGAMISGALYALALLRYRLFDPILVARETVIEQMTEGMLVFDTHQRLVDLNRAAETMLSLPRTRALGSTVDAVLPFGVDLEESPHGAVREVSLGAGAAARTYELRTSPLLDHRGSLLATLALIYNITDQKRAQAEIVEQQRLVAILSERQQLARDLHDGVAQVLNYAGLQARAIQKWIALGDPVAAQEQSQRLARVADDAHADIRASIRDLKLGSTPDWSLLNALERQVASFTASTGIAAELVVPPHLQKDPCRTDAGLQVLRVVQEALTNVRKHSGAASVRVSLDCGADAVEITVADNGRGFDPVEGGRGTDGHLGLSTMRERMAQVGGSVDIRSQAGAGTQVTLNVPRRARA